MNIKILICFIIICFLPAASASTADNVWTAKSAGFVGANDTLTFQNYLIKAKPIDSKKSSIIVYKNMIIIGQGMINVNDFQEYDNIRVALLGIKGNYSWIAVSKLETKELWKLSETKLLRWGEKYGIGNYTFSAETFSSDSVNLTISGKNAAETRLFSKGSSSDYDNLRVIVTDINESGFVELEFLTYPMPVVTASLVTDKGEYYPDETVQITVNTTTNAAQNIEGVVLETSMNAGIQPATFSLTGIKGDQSFQSQIKHPPPNSTVTITATTTVRDYYGNEYTTRTSKAIHIMPVISITKRVPQETDEQNVTVELGIYNGGSTEESISVYDFVYDDENLSIRQLNWTIKLRPGIFTNIMFPVSPQKLGRYVFPPAIAKWKKNSSSSNEAVMIVHRPLINLTKSAAKKDTVDVSLVIKNSGDRSALVNASDNIPDGSSIAGGNTTWQGLLEAGESVVIAYSLSGNVVALPAANATYRDIRGVTRLARSNMVDMAGLKKNTGISTEKNTEMNATEKNYAAPLNAQSNDLLSFMVLSFISIAGVVTGVTMSAYLSIIFKRR